jgi:hypothetical protein
VQRLLLEALLLQPLTICEWVVVDFGSVRCHGEL